MTDNLSEKAPASVIRAKASNKQLLQQTWIIILKELRDALRDRRSIAAGMIYAMITPIASSLIFMLMISNLSQQKTIEIEIQGQKYAQDLVRQLSATGIVHQQDPEKRLAITLQISEEFPQSMAEGLPAEVTLITNRSEQTLQQPFNQIKQQIDQYSAEIASLRLIARGINPQVSRPIQVNVQDMATRESRAGVILGGILLAITLSLFISGLNVAIDTSAGERERNSLALLLCQPVKPAQIIAAKTAVVSIFSMLGLILTVIVAMICFSYVPWHELGFTLNLTSSTGLFIVLIGIPIAFLATSMQLFFSFFAKSFKEAQSYMTIILFLPMALIMASSFDVMPEVLRWLPLSGQQQAITQVIKGQALPWLQIILTSILTLFTAFCFSAATSRFLKSEKVVFGL
ncbi:ABC transporter permease [Pelagibaculum spongiae]|uniref:Transporter n=1 Tax=Pelagibaculum spongiae TaxID=2080658 RepID=A0A2V1H4B8_9GAMM|nr:ABC transporter permease [Pelagibaculum spongiae]PVZ72037.1 transporter [Pelagibaculum spongiae]